MANEQNIGPVPISGDLSEIQKGMSDLVSSSEKIAEYVKNAGDQYDEYLKKYKDLNKEQTDLVSGLQSYNTLLLQTGLNADLLTNKYRDQLTLNKDIIEQQSQQLQNIQALGGSKPGTSDTDNAMLGWMKKNEASKESKNMGAQIGAGIVSPVAGAGKLMSAIPGWGQVAALIAAPIIKELGTSVSGMRSVTRTGGVGMSEGLGLSNTMDIQAEMRIAAMSIPFLKEKYADKAEMQTGMGTMFGAGGLRGDELSAVMEDLPKKAWEAGMKFSDVALIMAKSHRVLMQTPEEMHNAFDSIVKTAKEAGYAVKNYVKAVTDATFDIAAYGGTTKEVDAIMKEHYDLVQQNRLSEQDLTAIIKEGFRARMTTLEIDKRIIKMSETAIATKTKEIDAMKTETSVRSAVIAVLGNSKEAQEVATVASANLTEGIVEGSMQLETFTSVASDLTSIFGLSAEELTGFSQAINKTAKDVGLSGPELSKMTVDMAKRLNETTMDTGASLSTAGAITNLFARDMKEMKIRGADLTDMLSGMTEKFKMTNGQIVATAKFMVDMAETTGTSTNQIKQWTMGFAEGSREMFNTPQEAMANATKAVSAFSGLLVSGKMTMEDYNKVMRVEMDVFGKTGAESRSHMSTLASIVERTNVRMSELTQYTAELSKVNKQYGYEQEASTALLSVFNQHLRTGAVSLQDIQLVMKGASGMTQGPQALFTETAEGRLGDIFKGQDILTNIGIILPQLQRWVGGDEDAEDALSEILNANDMGNANRADIGELFRSHMQKMGEGLAQGIGLSGEGSDLESFKQATKIMYGTELSGYGSTAVKALKDVSYKGSVDVGDVAPDIADKLKAKGITDMVYTDFKKLLADLEKLDKDKAKPGDGLLSAYRQFDSSVNKFADVIDMVGIREKTSQLMKQQGEVYAGGISTIKDLATPAAEKKAMAIMENHFGISRNAQFKKTRADDLTKAILAGDTSYSIGSAQRFGQSTAIDLVNVQRKIQGDAERDQIEEIRERSRAVFEVHFKDGGYTEEQQREILKGLVNQLKNITRKKNIDGSKH